MIDLVVAADDRTGALEVAAALADHGGPVLMMPWAALGDDPTSAIGDLAPMWAIVVDLGSRHLSAGEAAGRAAVLDAVAASRHGHKIDSALRGNWATEVAARLAEDERPAVVAAALPSAGRFVRRGEVRQHVAGGGSVPIAEVVAADPRRPPASSRPSDHLRAAGVADVTDRATLDDVGRWLIDRVGGVLVPDLDGGADLAKLATALDGHLGVLLAGTAEAIAASAGATSVRAGPHTSGPAVEHVVVVVGSRHERARRQAERLRSHRRAARVTLVVAPTVDGPIDDEVAEAMATELAVAARAAVTEASALVVVGGDTAAAVLGDGRRRVVGTLGPGEARSFALGDDPGPPTITRAGSFGDDDALVTLVSHLLHPIEG